MMKEVNRNPKGLDEKRGKASLWLSHTTRSVRAFAFFVLALLAVPHIGHAATFRVNLAGADDPDMSPGDGVCDTGVNFGFVSCTLRAAIEESNALGAFGGPHEIILPGGTFFLRLGKLEITTSLKITGREPRRPTIVDALRRSTLLRISNPGTKVRIFGVTLRNGIGASGIEIREGSSLLLQDSTVSDNIGLQAEFQAPAILNVGFLSLVRSTVRDNQICDHFDFEKDKCLFVEGGGLSGLGGGILNDGRLVVYASTISNNRAKRGGGIYNFGRVDITNSTISGNKASLGGGIANEGRVDITFSTITRNGHFDFGDVRGGGGIANFGHVNIGDTILAGNTDDPFDSNDLDPSFSPDCITDSVTEPRPGIVVRARLGTFRSLGGNLVGLINQNCHWGDRRFDQIGEPSTGDALGKPGDGLNPLLDPLANNGGPTQTHALQKDSTARDRGTGGIRPRTDFFDCPGTDQRGVRRPQLVACDVGAFEAELR